ncbi:MAG: hypothetical protein PWR17_956 [Candidatus Methanomethylophilaceae archaeon]|nr:hypothetical protein [Candidatus Methanomethylophilaceae archaeon]
MCVVPQCTTMKVCYELRGDKKYAYRVTSKREPGKKYLNSKERNGERTEIRILTFHTLKF